MQKMLKNPTLFTNCKTKIALLLILFLASISRLYKLNSMPSILLEKEALIGYSTYSILKTGKDLTEKIPFLQIESPKEKIFSLYSLLSLPEVLLLDLNEASIRLPSAIAGILMVLFLYLLVKELFKKIFPDLAIKIALLSAFLLSISPWNIFYSRLVSIENLSLFFFIIGFYFLIKNENFILSTIFLIFSLLSWEGALILVPVLVVIYCLLNPESTMKKKLLISLGLVELACLSLTNQFEMILNHTLFRTADQINLPKKILVNFLDYFSAEFLFFLGDYRIKYWVVDLGVVYLFFLPFLIIGFVSLFKKNKKQASFLFFWILSSFLYAALGFNMRDAQRSLWASIPLQIIITVGALNIFLAIKNSPQKISKILFSCLLLVCFYNIILFYHFYFVHFPKKDANQPEYAFKKAGTFLTQNYQNYPKILVNSKYGDLYLHLLFYMKYPPRLYQASAQKPTSFGKLTFERVLEDSIDYSQKTLFLLDSEDQDLPRNIGMKKITDLSVLNGDSILSAWRLK